jgi:hypothetical protein
MYADGATGEADLDETITAVEHIVVSSHAGKRWVQRVIGIKDESQAEEYRRIHLKSVNDSILEAFSKAEKVWEEPEEDITFWFDENNMMFLKGRQEGVIKIITLYEEDFGFTRSINRIITLEQLNVLAKAREELQLANAKSIETRSQVESEVQAINDQITVLESQMALLVSERASKMALRDQGNKEQRLAKDKYTAEYNKLFKKWDA